MLTNSLRGFAGSSAVITKNIYPFPKRSPECALGMRKIVLSMASLVLVVLLALRVSRSLPKDAGDRPG